MEPVTLDSLARLVNGHVIGNSETLCRDARPLQEVAAGQITLLDDSRRLAQLTASGAAAVVVTTPLTGCDVAQLVVDDLHKAFQAILDYFRPAICAPASGISQTAHVDPTAVLGADCTVEAGAVVGPGVRIGQRCRLMSGVVVMAEAVLGDECTLFPGVVLYERTVLEDRVTIHAASVLGAYGFGYRSSEGRHLRTAQLGYVHIESDVEIGASVTIDRGTYGTTRVGTGTKIDNQVMIAHNCQIGRHNLICSQVGIAGSCRTGDYVVLAGQVGLKDHVTLGDRAIVGAQAGVMDDLAGGEVYLGSPATTHREQMQIMAVERRLPEIRKALKALTRDVQQLKQIVAGTDDSDAQQAA